MTTRFPRESSAVLLLLRHSSLFPPLLLSSHLSPILPLPSLSSLSPVLVAASAHVLHGRKTTGHAGVAVQVVQHGAPHLQVVGVSGGLGAAGGRWGGLEEVSDIMKRAGDPSPLAI